MIQFRFERNGFDKKVCKLPAANFTAYEKLLASCRVTADNLLHIYVIFTVAGFCSRYIAYNFLRY